MLSPSFHHHQPNGGFSPGCRVETSLVYYNQHLYLFGGDGRDLIHNDLYKYNIRWNQWIRIIPFGKPPSVRYGQSAVVYQHYMYIFGGYNIKKLGDLYRYDFVENKWEQLKLKGKPPSERSYHSGVRYKDKMIIFGGHNNQNGRFNDCYMMDFETHVWKQLKTKGDIPSKRSGHSAAVFKDFMIIFGGHDDVGRHNQVYELNLLNLTWRLIQCGGDIPSKRSGTPAVCLKDRYMLIFGGFDGNEHFNQFYMYDCWKNVWKKLIPKGVVPQERWYHAITLCEDSIFIYGGEGRDSVYLSDMFEIKLRFKEIQIVNSFWDVIFEFE